MYQDEYEGKLLRDDVSSVVSRYTSGVWFFKGNKIIDMRRRPPGHQSEHRGRVEGMHEKLVQV